MNIDDISRNEHSLLVTLWQMAEGHDGRHPDDGLKNGPVPFYIVTCSWHDIAARWRGEAPAFDDLRDVRETLEQLKTRRLDINGLEVGVLAVDPSGIDDMPVRLTLSTYVPMVLTALAASKP